MSVGKVQISKKISKNASITLDEASKFLESLLEIVKKKSKSKYIKISNFGSFSLKSTIERTGRNPKTKESYIIDSRIRLTLKVSNIIKESIN